MPHDMPREDYAGPAMYTFSYLARMVRYLVYGIITIGGISLTAFEGLHIYLENVSLAAPSRISSDEYGWEEETPSWTGGAKGGTDSRLGWKARHALRAAWICQEIGAGGSGSGSIGRSSTLHPTMGAIAGRVNQIDRGYELAEEYIDLAINQARKKGLKFPPNLPASVSLSGPSDFTGEKSEVDPTAVDLLLLKAGVLERIATDTSLLQAKDVYQQIFHAISGEARRIRISTKIGDLEARTGGDGAQWWTWGLSTAGVAVPHTTVEVVAEKAKGWFSSNKQSPVPVASTPTGPSTSSQLSPPVLRATITALISMEASLAKSGNLTQASAYQDLALSLIPQSPTQTPASDTAELHDLWLSHRSALLQLHKTSVTHALGHPAFALAQSTTTSAEAALAGLPTTSPSNLSHAAKLLSRDAHLAAAEANYIKGVMLEKQGVNEALEPALESFERAMSLSSADGEDVKGEEWSRYWRSYARVKSKMDKLLEK